MEDVVYADVAYSSDWLKAVALVAGMRATDETEPARRVARRHVVMAVEASLLEAIDAHNARSIAIAKHYEGLA